MPDRAVVDDASNEKEAVVNELKKRSRYTSDVAVNCRKCGDPLGYVVVYGHREWEHVVCPGAEVRPVYPSIERAYAAYDSDSRVNGPEDFEAFSDAVRPILEEALRNV